MLDQQVVELLYQTLETEMSGVQVYAAALACVVNNDLEAEWLAHLEQMTTHEQVTHKLFRKLGLDLEGDTPGREVVRHLGESMVNAIKIARQKGSPEAAQLVACECVTMAEAKEYQNWALLSQCAALSGSGEHKTLHEAYCEIEDEPDHHNHSKAWCRKLWFQSLRVPVARRAVGNQATA